VVARHTQKDVGNYEAKLVGMLTTRQCIFLGAGLFIVLVSGGTLMHVGATQSTIALVAIALMVIPVFFAFGDKLCYGQKPEEFLLNQYYYRKKCSRIRVYESKTLDDKLEEEELKKEYKELKADKKNKNVEKPKAANEFVEYEHVECDIRSFK